MNVDMTKNLTYASCTTNGGTAIAVKKRGSGAKSLGAGLETEYRFRIGRETWGDNNTRGDNKVDNKVDNNVRGDNKVDNKVDNNAWDDTVNDTVKHPQTRTSTTTPYNIRTRPVQHPYKTRRCRLGRVGFFHGSISGPLNGSLSGLKSGSLSGLKSSLNETDSKLIGFIQSNPSVTIQELQAMLNLSRNGVRKALGRLKATGWLRRIGPDKGGRWEVVKK